MTQKHIFFEFFEVFPYFETNLVILGGESPRKNQANPKVAFFSDLIKNSENRLKSQNFSAKSQKISLKLLIFPVFPNIIQFISDFHRFFRKISEFFRVLQKKILKIAKNFRFFPGKIKFFL